MDTQIILKEVLKVIENSFPANMFQRVFYKDENSYVDFFMVLDSDLGIKMQVDFMDKLINFDMIRLDEGRLYEWYVADSTSDSIRKRFWALLKYFNHPYDEKRSIQLECFHDKGEIPKRVEENIAFYKSIFQNENGVLTELHKPEIWKQIREVI